MPSLGLFKAFFAPKGSLPHRVRRTDAWGIWDSQPEIPNGSRTPGSSYA